MKWLHAAIAFMRRVVGTRTATPADSTATSDESGPWTRATFSSESLVLMMPGVSVKTTEPHLFPAESEMLRASDIAQILMRPREQMRLDDGIDIHEAAQLSGRTVSAIYMMRRRCPGKFPAPLQGGGRQGVKSKLFFRRQDVIDFAKREPARAS